MKTLSFKDEIQDILNYTERKDRQSSEGGYFRLKDIQDGESKRIRIVKRHIRGWEDWETTTNEFGEEKRKPHRFRLDDKPMKAFNDEEPIKQFCAFLVWDYEKNRICILSVTQMTVLNQIFALAADEDWGDYTQYDLKISKKGKDKNTRYTVNPLPKKQISAEIERSIKECTINLEALYTGEDPFKFIA